MKHLFYILILLFVGSTLQAQKAPYFQNPRKLKLGLQTTGDMLIEFGIGTPAYTPVEPYDPFVYVDEVTDSMYVYSRQQEMWKNILSGNNPADSSSVAIAFDSNRPILRSPTQGDSINGSTVTDWLEWWYFVPPDLTLTLSPSTTVYEVGTSNSITLNWSTNNPGGATLSNGSVTSNGTEIFGTASGTSGNSTITFSPTKGSTGNYTEFSYTFDYTQDWNATTESGTADATNRTIQAVYPVLYGMSATDLSSTGDPYTILNKLVATEGNKNLNLNGTGFIYFAIPKTWSDFDLSAIIDHNGFNVTGSFTTYDITVSSSGLSNNWSNVDYKLYKLNNTTTTNNFVYQIQR